MSYLELESADPLEVFSSWYADAVALGAPSSDAMTLATVDATGKPSARTVLYKGLYDGKIGFVSNYESRKAGELVQDPRAALVFFWPSTMRQVRFEGTIAKAPSEVSDRYFASRDRDSQIGAWASRQSQPIGSRQELLDAVEEVRRRFEGRPIERPPFWGMYWFDPEVIELWLSGDYRLHDRFRYVRQAGGFRCQRLSP
jgi:pyridoxamine 5'-phosphate oxidase